MRRAWCVLEMGGEGGLIDDVYLTYLPPYFYRANNRLLSYGSCEHDEAVRKRKKKRQRDKCMYVNKHHLGGGSSSSSLSYLHRMALTIVIVPYLRIIEVRDPRFGHDDEVMMK